MGWFITLFFIITSFDFGGFTNITPSCSSTKDDLNVVHQIAEGIINLSGPKPDLNSSQKPDEIYENFCTLLSQNQYSSNMDLGIFLTILQEMQTIIVQK